MTFASLSHDDIRMICEAIIAVCTVAGGLISMRNGRKLDRHAQETAAMHAQNRADIAEIKQKIAVEPEGK